MAPLTTAAEAARGQAARLRGESQGLRFAVRANLARSREKLDRAEAETKRSRARCATPLASPWSSLEWHSGDERLGRVLVPVD